MFLLIVQIVEHKADLLMFVLIVLEFWSLSQGHRLTGDIKRVQVLNKKVWLEKKFLVRVLYLFRRNRLFSLLGKDQFNSKSTVRF